MTPDYRALCAELLRSLENYPVQPPRDRDLCVRARALLAQPEAEGLTDQELLRCGKIATPCHDLKLWERELNMMRAAIAADRARWGRPAAAPVPEPGEVAELVAALGSRDRWTQLTDAQVDRAATLLQQLSALAIAAELEGAE